MCILLICVFKLPKLLKTQLHSVQLYVGPFFTFKKKSKFSLHIPNIMFFNIFLYNKYTMGLWELKWFIFSSYQYAVMESGWHLLDIMNYNLWAWLQLLTTTSQQCEAPDSKTNILQQTRPQTFLSLPSPTIPCLKAKLKCNFIN